MVLGLLVLASALTAIAAGIGLLPVALLFVAKPLATVLLIVRAAGAARTSRAHDAGSSPASCSRWPATWPCCGPSRAFCRD
ncbi:MAG: hypothetical protein U1E80_12305 [Piscinibacter sp.]